MTTLTTIKKFSKRKRKHPVRPQVSGSQISHPQQLCVYVGMKGGGCVDVGVLDLGSRFQLIEVKELERLLAIERTWLQIEALANMPEELEGVNPGEFEMDVVEKGNDQLSIMAYMGDEE